jgi:hypothetical protein
MDTKKIGMALLAASLLLGAACGTGQQQSRPDEQLIAMNRPRTDVPPAGQPVAGATRIPDAVLHDPAEKFAFMERLRTQISAETRQVAEPRWSNEVRPALRRQLADAGLPRSDVDFLLWELDAARR